MTHTLVDLRFNPSHCHAFTFLFHNLTRRPYQKCLRVRRQYSKIDNLKGYDIGVEGGGNVGVILVRMSCGTTFQTPPYSNTCTQKIVHETRMKARGLSRQSYSDPIHRCVITEESVAVNRNWANKYFFNCSEKYFSNNL